MSMQAAELKDYGILAASGADVRAFLHAQLTNDVANLPAGHARYAGWCSAKGRLMASMLVVPHGDDILLQMSRDIAAPVAKRLSMFVLRAKAKIADESDGWKQHGIWGEGAAEALAGAGLPAPQEPLAVATAPAGIVVAVEPGRFLVLSRTPPEGIALNAGADDWALAEIHAGRPLITLATQEQFVPQMTNLELLGGVDFKKGCYPGQEIVARTQYRGILKRRMFRLRGEGLQAGQDVYSDDDPAQASGKVVNAAGGEALAVLQIISVEQKAPLRTAPGAAPLEVLSLPYAQ